VSPWIALESIDERKVVAFHRGTGARLQLSRGLYDFLRRFEQPATLAEALGAEPDARVLEPVRALRDRGFLVDAEAAGPRWHGRRTIAAAQTLFSCPPYRPEDAAADVAVLGAPCDLGSASPGARSAPEAIRRSSCIFEYQLGFESGRPRGWFDVDRRERILEGVSFRDRGDVAVHYGEPPEDYHGRVAALVGEMLDAGSLPVLLGGDRTVVRPAVEAHRRREPLTVLTLDAETRPRKAALLAELPEDQPVYVVLDPSVLDPAVAPGATRSVPGGLTFDELAVVLRTVARARRVAGLAVVELDPGRDAGHVTSLVVCHLLLAVLGEVFAARRRG
jgi:arginase family enzyme